MTPISKYRTDIYGGSDLVVGVPFSTVDAIFPTTGCPVNISATNPNNVITVGCTANRWSKINTSAYLANAYVDLGHWYGFTPYLGAGVGLGYVQAQSNVFFRFVNGTPYGDGHSYCGGSTGVAGVNCFILGYPNGRGLSITNYNVAYALMAGFSYDISSLLKFDIGYRYLNLGSGVSSQQIRAGVRITPDG
jgi:opacity protein-like surface antigen